METSTQDFRNDLRKLSTFGICEETRVVANSLAKDGNEVFAELLRELADRIEKAEEQSKGK